MVTITKPFLALTAADLMSEPLVALPQQMSLPMAAHLLSMHQVSGAPVIDEHGVCVGVLSATDFMHWAQQDHLAPHTRSSEEAEFCQSWQIVEPDSLPNDAVAGFMTAAPVTVAADMPIAELARRMVDAHIHRVIVVDEDGRPRGIISSTDILAAVAYADPAAGQRET